MKSIMIQRLLSASTPFSDFNFLLPLPNSKNTLPLSQALLTVHWSKSEIDHEYLEIKKIVLCSGS